MHVQLQAIRTKRQAAIECRHCVFGSEPGPAAMGKDQWTIGCNRRMHGRILREELSGVRKGLEELGKDAL
jgi:hypothetical protein